MSTSADATRIRVRMPGKHIVLFAAAALAAASAGIVIFSPSGSATSALPRDAAPTRSVPLDAFLVDLAPDRSGRIAYLRLVAEIVVPADRPQTAERIAREASVIRERLSFFLRGLSPEDFAGADGMARVKAELLRRVNIVIAPDAAADVVVTDIVIQ